MERLNRIAKKLLPKFKIVLVIECIVLGMWFIFMHLYMPTKYMDDTEATKYIMSMEMEDRDNYIKRLPNPEGDRLIDLMLTYKIQKAVSEDTFE